MSTSNVAICAPLGENAVPKEPVVHTDVEVAESNGRQLATDMKAAVREEADGGVALEVEEAYSDEKFVMGVEKDENKPREKHAQIGTPMGETSAPEKPATLSEERNLGPTERIFNEPTNCIEAPSDCSVDSLLGIDATGVFSEAVLGPEQCVSLRAPFLADRRPPATEDRAQGVGLAESLVTIAQAKIGVSRLSTDHNSPLALAKASALDDETARILRVRDIDVVEQTGGDEVDEVAGLLLDQASADQEPFAFARSSDSCMGSSTGVSMHSDITSEVAPASAQADAPTSDVASKALLPEGANVLNTAALASSFSGDSPPPVNMSAIISSSSLFDHIAFERTSSHMPVGTMSIAPSSPLTELSSESDDGDRTRESSAGYQAGTDANIPVEGHKGEVFPATRSLSRALSSSDEINQNGSDSSGGSGSSNDTTSSDFSSLPTLTPPPRQFLDCINPPPFCVPKELYCPMEEAYTDLAPRALNSAEPAIVIPSPQNIKNVITSDPDSGDNGHDGQQEVTPDPISAPRGRKRKRRRHSRSRSPLHMYGEEEALALFGQNVTLYSVCGPPGGIPIGVGTLQCHPDDGGRASFNLYIEDEMQHLLVETMKTAVQNEPEASGSRSTRALNRFSKPQTAKRRGTKNKFKSRAKDTNEQDLANYSSCHACSRKTDYPKMKCSNLRPNGARCKFQFCGRCVERIFPKIQFDTQNLDFTCPRCAGTCPCMSCKTSQSKMPAKLDENVKEDVVPTDPNADLVSATGPSSKNGQSSLSHKALRKATATMQSTKLKRKADDDGYEEEASMSEAYPGKDDTITNSTVVDKASHGPMAKNVSKRARGPQATNLMHDIAPKHGRKLCHQCRTRSTYAKMYCNVITESGEICKMSYCHRCISNRYPGFVFTVDGSFTCFKCSNSCNCDVCARRRGEEYIKSAYLNKVITENGRTSASSPISTPPTERARLKMPEAIAQCKPTAPQIDKEADEWFRSHRPELDTASNNGNSLKVRTRAFVGDWSPSWSPMRSCVEMESALVPTEPASGESSSRLRPHLYIGKPITFQSSTVPLDTTCGMSSPLRSLSQSQKSQTKSLPSARSRSGRALKHSEKVRQYESGSEDDLPSSSARKRRRKIISSSAHDSASPSLSSESKTSTTERSSSHARLTSM